MGSNPATTSTNAPWPTTLWPLIRDLDQPGHRKLASEVLAARYWRPVYAFLRRKGYDHHDGFDHTQDFFLALFDRDWVLRADERKGRFRTFLVTLLNRYVRDLSERRQVRFEKAHQPLPFDIKEDDPRLLTWLSCRSSEEAFWLQYVRDLLDRVLALMRKESELDDNSVTLDENACRLFLMKIEKEIDGSPIGWRDLGAEFRMTPPQARYAFHKGVARFKEILALELGEEGDREKDFQEAVAEMFQIVQGEGR